MDNDYEKDYQEFWKDIIEKPDGAIDIEQVKKELYDFHTVMREVRTVYDRITFGKISKVNTMADYVISVWEDECQKFYDKSNKETAEEIFDALELMLNLDGNKEGYVEISNHIPLSEYEKLKKKYLGE